MELSQAIQIVDPTENSGTPAVINGPLPTGTQYNTLADIINPILKYVMPIALLIAFILLVWAGFELVRSFGNPEALKKASARLTNVIIGLILLAFSYWLAGFVASIFFP